MLHAVETSQPSEQEQFQIEPFQDIVIVKRLTEEKHASGLYLPNTAGEYAAGRVVAVGPGRVYSSFMDASGRTLVGQFVPTTVKVGDFVVVGRYNSGGEPIEFNGEKYLMCRESDLGGRSRDGSPVKIRLVPQD